MSANPLTIQTSRPVMTLTNVIDGTTSASHSILCPQQAFNCWRYSRHTICDLPRAIPSHILDESTTTTNRVAQSMNRQQVFRSMIRPEVRLLKDMVKR